MSEENLGPEMIPNSPEFAGLDDYEKLLCLADRWRRKYGTESMPTLVDLRGTLNDLTSGEESERPQSWYYEDGDDALKRWLDNQTLVRCSIAIPFGKTGYAHLEG